MGVICFSQPSAIDDILIKAVYLCCQSAEEKERRGRGGKESRGGRGGTGGVVNENEEKNYNERKGRMVYTVRYSS